MTDAVDWMRWNACPTCKALRGHACRSLSGAIADGRPDSVLTKLDQPHTMRKMRRRA
jgi:hypothetical protein